MKEVAGNKRSERRWQVGLELMLLPLLLLEVKLLLLLQQQQRGISEHVLQINARTVLMRLLMPTP
jgi:hypothetical protein